MNEVRISLDFEQQLNQLYVDGKISRGQMMRIYKETTGDFALMRFLSYVRGVWHLIFLD